MENEGSLKSLASKLVKVMSKSSNVKKTGRNDFQKYDYATEADILREVRQSLIEENVFIFSSIEGSHKEGDLTTVKVKNTFVDGDSGETFSVFSLGQGMSKNDDKGSNKAITAASKYFLLKNFLLPTGEDSEATDASGTSTASRATTVAASVPLKAVASESTEVKKPASFRSPKKVVASNTDDF